MLPFDRLHRFFQNVGQLLPSLVVIIHLVQSHTDVRITQDGLVKLTRTIVITLSQAKIALFRCPGFSSKRARSDQFRFRTETIAIRLLLNFARTRLKPQTLCLVEFGDGFTHIPDRIDINSRQAQMRIRGAGKQRNRFLKPRLGRFHRCVAVFRLIGAADESLACQQYSLGGELAMGRHCCFERTMPF